MCPLCMGANYCCNRCRDLDWYIIIYYNINKGLYIIKLYVKKHNQIEQDLVMIQ